jgi:response regulator of citrate/malate metabolism
LTENKRGILDYRDHRFIQVTKSVIDDTVHFDRAVDKLVYVIICSYANNKTKQSFPSVKTIAEKALCSENTVRKAVKKLCELKLIRVEMRYRDVGSQTSNTYILLEPPDGFISGVQRE